MEAELSGDHAAVALDERPESTTPGGIEDAERVVYIALACELARGRSALVVDDGVGALREAATRVTSRPLNELEVVADGDFDFAVIDVTTPSADLSDFSRVVNPRTGFAVARFPNDINFVEARASFVRGFGNAATLFQQEWTTSSLFSEAMALHDHPARAVQSSVRKLAAAQPGEERFHIVVAAHGPMPKLAPQLAVASGSAQRELIISQEERIASQSAQLEAQRQQITALSDRLELAQEDLAARESEPAPATDLSEELAAAEARIAELEAELSWYPANRLPVKAQVEEREWASSLLSVWRRAVRRIEQLAKRG